MVSFTSRSLYPQGKTPCYPLDRRMRGPQSRSELGEEKSSQPLPGLEPQIIRPVALRLVRWFRCVAHFLQHPTEGGHPRGQNAVGT